MRKKTFIGESESPPSFRLFGRSFPLPLAISKNAINFMLFSLLFIILLNVNVFDRPEERNCFAILVFASALWALEVLNFGLGFYLFFCFLWFFIGLLMNAILFNLGITTFCYCTTYSTVGYHARCYARSS